MAIIGIDHPCPKYGGRGEIEQEEILTATLPKGVEDGMALRVPGHGLPSPESGGQPDSVLRLRGKGLPEFGGSGSGDLCVQIQPQAPQHLSSQGKALYQQLRALASGSH